MIVLEAVEEGKNSYTIRCYKENNFDKQLALVANAYRMHDEYAIEYAHYLFSEFPNLILLHEKTENDFFLGNAPYSIVDGLGDAIENSLKDLDDEHCIVDYINIDRDDNHCGSIYYHKLIDCTVVIKSTINRFIRINTIDELLKTF